MEVASCRRFFSGRDSHVLLDIGGLLSVLYDSISTIVRLWRYDSATANIQHSTGTAQYLAVSGGAYLDGPNERTNS